jgi:hypothetical protein
MEQEFALTSIETDICQTIENLGWHAHLWFPIVDRETLQFQSSANDDEIHATIVRLIRNHVLINANPEGWRPPNFSPAPDIQRPILPSPGYLALAHRMPLVAPGPIERALQTQQRWSESHTQVMNQPVESLTAENITLTDLEAQIVESIDHVGWYSYLWFPVIARETLNFGSDEPEETVHAAIRGLIQKRALVAATNEPGDLEQWMPIPEVLRAANHKMVEILRALDPNPWPDRFDERFHIFAHGKTFDVDAFLRASTIHPDYIWRNKGSNTNGIEILLGDGRETRLVDQEEIATEYLKRYKDELRALAEFPGVDAFILGLVAICKPETTGFCVGPPTELMQYALEIGIWPLYYGTIDGRGSAGFEPVK